MTAARSGVSIDRERVERIVRDILKNRFAPKPADGPSPLVVNISARHLHITQEDLERLFGAGAKLTPYRMLYQEGEFASEQLVDLIGPRRRMLANVRILGPCRPFTQVELAFSDAVGLGLDVPVRMSGDHHDTPGCLVLGPAGHLVLESGVIRAMRHVHMSSADAEYYGVTAGDKMKLVVEHDTCPITIDGIVVRIHAKFKLEVHLDTDEGNACDLPHARGVRWVEGNAETLKR